MQPFDRRAASILSTSLLSIALSIGAKEWSSTEVGVSFQIPDDPSWHQIAPPTADTKLVLQSQQKGIAMFFMVMPAPSGQKILDNEFIRQFETKYYPQGRSSKFTGEFFSFKGKRAYKTTGEVSLQGITLKRALIVWIEREKVFEISSMKRDGNPLEDESIKAFVESLKFTGAK